MDEIFGVGSAPVGTVLSTPLLGPSSTPQSRPSTTLQQPPANAVCSKRKKSGDLQETHERHAEQRMAALEAMVYPKLQKRHRLKERAVSEENVINE